MKLVMDTENARALAVAYGQQSDEALRMATTLTSLLADALVDDTYDVAGSLNGLSEHLHLGDVVLRHQADIMDGLAVDVDALSQEMGVNRWKLDKQLEKVEWGGIDAGDVLISLVDFGKDSVTGLDTTIRDFVPDAGPIGQDPEFDALIQRLDGWLLSAIVDGGSIDGLLISDGRIDDLDALATLLGREDLATITVTREFSEERRVGQDEYRTRTEIRTIPLPTSEHQDYTIDFVTDALIAERKLSRAAVLPTLGDLFDFTTYQESYEHRLGQDEYETRQRTKDRTAEQVADLIAEANEKWEALAWLPAVLLGQGLPPADLATDRALQDQVVRFATELGYDGSPSDLADDVADPEASAPALDFLVAKGRDLMADALENPEPIQKARLPLASGALDASIEFGRAQGVITDETEANARAIALHLSGLDRNTDLAGVDPAELALEAPELDTTALVGLLATAIPPHLLTENRLVQAVTYVQRADTVADRVERIERTVLGLKTVTTVGEPAMTQSRWLASLPKKVQEEHFNLDISGKEFDWLLTHDGVPGYHKSPDWRKGKGKRYFHLVNEVDGSVDDFIVEKIPKKQGWFGQAVMSIAKVAISIYFPPMGAAIAAMDAAIAASQGNWMAAGMAALGAVAAGTAAWASSASATAAQATNDAISAIGGSASALQAAETAAVAATATANTANTAANAAMAVNAGVKAGVAFSQDDLLGGVVNSVTALGAGASTFGYANAGQALATGATATGRIADTVEAIEDDDIAGAVAGGLGSASSLIDLSLRVDGTAGGMADGTANTLDRVSNTLDDAADLTRAGGAVATGIEDEEWASLVGGGLRFGSSALRLAGNEDGVVSGMLFDRSAETTFDDGVGAIDTTRSWLDGAADLADGGLAIAEGDFLGGTALLSSGTSGLVRGGGVVDVNLERLASIGTIADKIVTAGPGLDHADTMQLIGGDMQNLVDSFRAPEPEFVSSGDARRDLATVQGRRQVAKAGLNRLDDLLAFDTTDGTVGALLGTTRTELAGEVATLERQEEVATKAVEREDEARRAAEAAAAAAAARLPSHVPTLKPPMPSHVPLARPDDLIPFGTPVVVQTNRGPMVMTPGPDGLLIPVPATSGPGGFGNGSAGTGRPGQPIAGSPVLDPSISLDAFPLLHPARLYEDVARWHPGPLLPEVLGDWNVEGSLMVGATWHERKQPGQSLLDELTPQATRFGPFKVPLGGLVVGSAGRETFADGRVGYGYTGKYGTRTGIVGPVLPAVEAGYVYDQLMGGGLELLGQEPPGGMAFQAIGPRPGVAPSEMYSLTNPWAWDPGASVRLNGLGGHEHHLTVGNGGPVRASLFDEEIRHLLDFYQVTGNGDEVEIAQGDVSVNVTQPGAALTVPFNVLGMEELRLGSSMMLVDGEADLTSVSYDPTRSADYGQHMLMMQPRPGEPTTHTKAIFGASQNWLDATLGPTRPMFDSNLNLAKLFPKMQWFAASSQLPDGSWKTDYSTDGRSEVRIEGSTTIGRGGGIEDFRIASSVAPDGFRPVPFELDADAYVAVLESLEHDRDPLKALDGREGVPEVLVTDPIYRLNLRRQLNEIDESGALSRNHPIAGNLQVRETPRGEPILELIDSGPAEEARLEAERLGDPSLANPPFRNTHMPMSEITTGFAREAVQIANEWNEAREYAMGGASWLGLHLTGIGNEADRLAAAEWEAEHLDATIAAGYELGEYAASRATNPLLLAGDAYDAYDGFTTWAGDTADELSEAWATGDGERLGAAAARTLAFGTEVAVAGVAARGTYAIGRRVGGSPPDVDARPTVEGPGGQGSGSGGDSGAGDGSGGSGGGGSDGDGPGGSNGAGGDDGPEWVLPHHDSSPIDGGADSSAAGARLRQNYNFMSGPPLVADTKLANIVSNGWRGQSGDADPITSSGIDNKLGNGWSVTAALNEARTGRPTGPTGRETFHLEKVRNDAKGIGEWLATNPDVEPGQRLKEGRMVTDLEAKQRSHDRRVATQMLDAHLEALREARNRTIDGDPPEVEAARAYLGEVEAHIDDVVTQQRKAAAAAEESDIFRRWREAKEQPDE